MDNYRMNKHATCSHCSQLFVIKDPLRPRGFRCPLVLSCGHSVCELCVKTKIQNCGDLTCAICKNKTNTSQEGTMKKDLPINLYLLGCFVDNYTSTARVDSKIIFQPAGANLQTKRTKKNDMKIGSNAEVCSECTQVQTLWSCPQCDVLYCSQCYNKVHKAAKALQRHKKIPLGSEGLVPVIVQSRCKVHADQKLEYHCQECDVIMCPRCALEGHKNHSIWSIQDRNENMLPAVKEAYEKANVTLERLMKTQKDVLNASTSNGGKKVLGAGDVLVQTQHAISRHFVHVHGVLQLLEASLLRQLEEEYIGTAHSLAKVAQKLDSHIMDLKCLLDEAVEACDPSNLPQSNMEEILQKLLAAESLPCHLITQEATDDAQLRFTTDESFIQQLSTHCKLEIPASKKFILARTEDLPEDYIVEPIEESYSGIMERLAELRSIKKAEETSSASHASSSNFSDGDLSDSSSLTSLSQGLNYAQPVKGSSEVVTISHLKDPSSFYVIRESDKKKLENLTKQLSLYVGRGPKTPTAVLLDSLYVVQFGVDKKWYRARVKRAIPSLSEMEEDKVEVLYIDYGNTEIVPVSRFRCIHHKYTIIRPIAEHCSLYGLAPIGGTWSREAIKTMVQMLDGWRVVMSVMGFEMGVYHVDLSRCPTDEESDVPISVRDAMVFLELGCFLDSTMPSLQINAVNKQYLGAETLKKEVIYDVLSSHINNPSSFYVQKLGSHAHYLTTVMEDMNQTYNNAGKRGMIYTPKVGMVCAAQYSADKKWYRARISGLPGHKKVELSYVDFGNKEVVSWTDLRRLHDRFLRLAPQAIHCSLSEIMPAYGSVWSKEAAQYFIKIASKKPLKLFVDEVQKTQTRVILYESQTTVDICLNALLVKNEHALSTGSSSLLVKYHKTGARVLSRQQPRNENNAVPIIPQEQLSSKKYSTAMKKSKSKKSKSMNSSPKLTAVPVPEPELSPGEDRFRLEVTVLSAPSPSLIYVSLTSQETVIGNLMLEMQEYYKDSNDLDDNKPWKEHDKCCAFSLKEKKWYRGIIIEMKDDFSKVFLKDFAMVETVPLKCLRQLAPQFLEVRDGAVKCHLAGIKAAGDKAEWPTLSCEQLNELISRYDHHFISKKGEIENFSLPIELWIREIIAGGPLDPTIEKWVTLNWKLVDHGLAIPIRADLDSENVPSYQVLKELEEQNQDTGPVSFPATFSLGKGSVKQVTTFSLDSTFEGFQDESDQLNLDELEGGEMVTDWLPPVPITKKKFSAVPTFVDDDCHIYLHEIECEETLNVIQKALQCRLENSQPKPHDLYWFAGQLCIAQYHDKNWYRGKVLEVKDDHTVKVLFVDYGNIEELKAVEMRKNIYLGYIPVQCHKYKLDGIVPISDTGKWPIPVLDLVHTTIVEKNCRIIVRADPGDESPPLISLIAPGSVDLAALLVNMQYAKYTNTSLQLKASVEPPMFRVQINSQMADADQDSDSASVIIEEEITKELDDVENEGEYEEDSECAQEVKQQDLIGGEAERFVSEENVDKTIMDFKISAVKENDVQIQTEEKNVHQIFETETLAEEVVIQAQIEGTMLVDSKDLSEAETEKTENLTEIETEVNTVTQTEIKEDTVIPTSSEEKATKVDEVEQDKAVEVQTKKNDMNLVEETEQSKLWIDCLSEDESEQGELQRGYQVLNLQNRDEILVEVSAIISPTEIVIRPMECEENAELMKDFLVLSMKMQEEASFQPVIYSPYIGQPCCVCFKEDGQWYRATVIHIDSNTSQLKIQYVDYGNVEMVKFNEVHELKPEWTEVPLQGIQCNLWKVKSPATFNPQELLARLTDCLFQPPLRAKIKVRGSSQLSVELFARSSNVPIYQPLLDSGVLQFDPEGK